MLNNYLEKNYNKLKDIAHNLGGKNKDDLLSFVIEELYKCDQNRINKIIEKKQMTFFITRIMVNQYFSKTSRYFKKYNKYYKYHISGQSLDFKEVRNNKENSIIKINEKLDLEKKIKWIDKKLKKLYWFDAQVFKLYYKENHSLNSLAKATKISRATLYKSITTVKKYLLNAK